MTFTVSPTWTATLPPMPFHVKVKVFNAAGEEIGELYNGGVSQMPGSPKLDATVLQPGAGAVNLVFAGVLASGGNSLPWLGLGGGGALVKSGIYYFSVESSDSFGKITTYSLSVSVIAPKPANEINIYNSAGEIVYHESFASLTVSATDLSLNQQSFAPSAGKLQGSLRDAQGTLSAWTWDGTGSDGHQLSPGLYTIQLINSLQGAASKPVVRTVQLLGAPDAADAAPRVVYGSQGLMLRYDPAAVASGLRVRLYNMAGELAGSAAASGTPGEIIVPTAPFASGIYVIVFEYQTPSGLRKRSLVKAALLR